MSEDLQRQINDHIDESDRRWERLEDSVENLRDNHVAHLSSDLAGLKTDVAGVKADVKWVKIIGSFIIMESLAILIKLFL